MMSMEEDLELRALKLRKFMELAALRSQAKAAGSEKNAEKPLSFEEALKIVRENLVERGDEVLDAALEQYPEQAKKIVMILAEKIIKGEIGQKIRGSALMSLFDYLGMPVKLRSRILYYKKGEYKSIEELLRS
ncbi:MAG: hypothetical protein QW624_02335 [Nitrososphaerota archaeon]